MQNAPTMLGQKMMNRQAPYGPIGMVAQNMSGNKKGGAAGGGAPAGLGLAFDPTTASAGVTFTNNNITAQNTSGATIRSAKSANGSTVGLVANWYCEFTVGSTGQMFVGIGPSSFVCNTVNRVGIGVGNGVSYRPDTGEIYRAGAAQITGLATALTGDVIGIKLDLTDTTSFITVLKNGVVILAATDMTAYIPNNTSSWIPVWSSGATSVIASISNNIYEAPGYIPFTTAGTSAIITASASVPAVADGAYDVYTFNASGTFTAGSTGAVRALVIAGGGGGGSTGGGGAGGYLENGATVTPQTYTVTVGGGGAFLGSNGTSSSIGSLISTTGGGRGTTGAGASGGSGSGGSPAVPGPNTAAGGAGISGQGFAGGQGNSVSAVLYGGGGGGGAGSVGGSGNAASNGLGGNGGTGKTSDITGASVGRGGGGGAYGYLGNGTTSNGGQQGSGTNNTGGGGGWSSGSGGSGVVIIRVRARA